ncbi:MAG: class I SAM-dependent methyltransferase [Treponema sp.]|nr:class I SAM-dependent methyltransferase [Treponema sp.]
MSEWFESEDFWTTYGPIMYDDNLWSEAPDVAEYVVKLGDLKKGAKILDAACGIGRISTELALLGMDVTGVDITKSVLEAAIDSAQAENLRINFVNQDLRTFCQPDTFDCAVNLYTSFGYCDSKDDDYKILKNIASSLKKGGTFIMECTSRETAIMYFTPGETFERAGFTVETEFSVVGDWEGLNNKWTLIDKNGKKIVHNYVQRLYSAPELRDKLLELGFSSAKVYGDFTKTPYDQHARTMILVAKK